MTTLTKIASSQIAAVGHDAEKNLLTVEFHNGATWTYNNVSKELYEEMLAAPSVGSFFSKKIKADGTKHEAVKIK